MLACHHMQTKYQKFLWPILSGIFIGTSYIPFPPWATLFAFVPLWVYWHEQKSLKNILIGGWVTQFLLTLIGFNWVAHTIHEFGHLPWPVAILGLVLFCGFANLQVPLAGLMWWLIRKRWPLSGFASAVTLAACQMICDLSYPMIFEWHMAYPLLATPLPVSQLAEVIGFRGLSSIIIGLNALVLWLFWQRKHKRTLGIGLLNLGLFIIALNLAGQFLKDRIQVPDQTAHVLMVQANIGNLEKQEAEKGDLFRESIIDRYLNLTEQGLNQGPVTFALWPETAFPHLLTEPYFSTHMYAGRLRRFLQDHQLNLVTGAYGLVGERNQISNSLFMLTASGEQGDQPYHKTRLLAFGEYLPGATMFPVLQTWLPEVGNFARGAGPDVRTLDQIRLGPLICYEGLFDDFPRELANRGAQILVNVTNDSWYGKWQQPFQHLYMTLARSIELRRPILRSTNTGISTVMLADGELLVQSPLHQEWQHLYEVPYASNPHPTWFMGYGYYFSWALALVFLTLGIWRGWRART